jgi:hypothetical protein
MRWCRRWDHLGYVKKMLLCQRLSEGMPGSSSALWLCLKVNLRRLTGPGRWQRRDFAA